MTAQSSAAKSRLFFKFPAYYTNKLRYLRPNLIMNSILALFSYPPITIMLIIITNMQRDYLAMKESGADMNTMLAESDKISSLNSVFLMSGVIGILCLVALFVFTFVTTLRSFRYLSDKTYVDMDYSLPVDHNTRFFGDLAAVFTTTIPPHLAAIIIGIILLNCSSVESFMELSGFDVFTGIKQMAFVGLFACIMQIGLTLLVISLCGKKAEAALYPILLSIAIPIIHCLVISLIQSGIYGSVNDYYSLPEISSMYSLSSTSPIGMLIITVYAWTNIWQSSDDSLIGNAPIFTPEYFIPALLITLACFAAAYFLMKNRRNERVGMPFVVKGSSLVVPGFVIFAIALPLCIRIFTLVRKKPNYSYSYTESPLGWIIALIISTFIVYIVMELISGRNFRKFPQSLVKWAGTLAASVGISAVLAFSDGFGASYYVPAESDVSTAYLFMNQYPYTEARQVDVSRLSDQNSLHIINEIHKMIPKDGSEEGDEKQGGFIRINYLLNNGEYLQRAYTVSAELYDKCMRLTVDPDMWYNGIYAWQLNDNMQLLSVQIDETTYTPSSLTTADILDALKKDSRNVSYENLHTLQPGAREYYATIQTFDRGTGKVTFMCVVIHSWMENTINLFQNCGFRLMQSYLSTAESAFIAESDNMSILSGMAMAAISDGMDDDELEEYLNELSDAWGFYPEWENCRFGRPNTGDPDLEKLISVCYDQQPEETTKYCVVLEQAYAYDKYNLASLQHNPTILYVPAEYNSLAEKLLAANFVYDPQ